MTQSAVTPRADISLRRKACAEFVGTAYLVAAVVGSGIMATRLTDDVGVQLLCNSLATGAALVALILTLGQVSAAFNPVVTLLDVALGNLAWSAAAVLSTAQIAGGIAGVVTTNLMFDLDAITTAATERSGAGQWLGEGVATLGLVLVIFGPMRSGRADRVAITVAGYITAAYWFTSSTSFANPAVTIARAASDTFAGISPGSVPGFVLAQLAGATVGYLLIQALFPRTAESDLAP